MMTPIKCVLKKKEEEVKAPGDYFVSDSFINIYLPNGAGSGRIRVGGVIHPAWNRSGPDDCLTLKPSIHVPGFWHGWMTDGMLHE